MADVSLSASGNEEKKVSRVNSFTNFIRSPSRPKSMKKSPSNPLSRLLFRRKSSKKDIDSQDEGSTGGAGGDDGEDENAPSLVEEVKEVVGTAIDNVLHHHHKHTSTEEANDVDVAVSTKARDVSSTDVAGTKENKPSLLDKFKEELHVAEHSVDHLADKFKVGLGKAKESFKGDYDKATEGLESILHIDHKSSEKKPSVDIISDNKKPIVEEVKAPSLAKRVQEEVVAVVNTIKDDPKKGESGKEESKEIKGEIKKEDGCVSSLAQGLEKICAPWSSKKEV